MNSVFEGERLVQYAVGTKRNITSLVSGRKIEERVLGKASRWWWYLNWAWKDEQECSRWERRGRASLAGDMTCPRSTQVSEVFRREDGVCAPADAAMRDSMK